MKVTLERGNKYLKTIRRDNRAVQALSLPKVANYNMRSLITKIGKFSNDMLDRSVDIAFLTEVWKIRSTNSNLKS